MNKNLAAAKDEKNRDKETNAETAWVRTTSSLVISCNILHARYIVVRLGHMFLASNSNQFLVVPQLTVTKISIYTLYLYIFITVRTAPQLNRLSRTT